MPHYICDLHLHTDRSDGSSTPKELVDDAAAMGMAVIAITDHDVRPPTTVSTDSGEQDIVHYAASKNLRLIHGIEISCETEVEDTHIVGFGCDWQDPFFGRLEASVSESKRESYRKLVDALNSDGIAVTWEEVLDNNGAPVAESAVQKKMLFELMARKGYSKSWDDAKLMIKNTPRYQINRKKPGAIAVIQAIHEAGGIAILAHPYLVSEMVTYEHNTISRDEYIRAMISAGLDGIEVNYPYDKTSYGGTLTNEQIADEILEKYGALVTVLSGGSDYHADHKKGVKNARQIGDAGIEIDYFKSNPYLSNLP